MCTPTRSTVLHVARIETERKARCWNRHAGQQSGLSKQSVHRGVRIRRRIGGCSALRERRDEEIKRWNDQCDESIARGEKKPEKPKRVEGRAKTPPIYEEWITAVDGFDQDKLRELHDTADEVKGKEQKKQVLFDTMNLKELLVSD